MLLLLRESFWFFLFFELLSTLALYDCAYLCNETISLDTAVAASADYSAQSLQVASSQSVFHIDSPQYPNDYPSDTRCGYVILVPQSFRVKISFLSFHVEEPFKDGSCVFDKLTISTSTVSKDFCGQQNDNLHNLIFILDDPEINLKFESDDLKQFSGFRMEISFYSELQTISLSLSLQPNASNGQIYSPNYALSYPFLPENLDLQISLSADTSYCIIMTYSTLNDLSTEKVTDDPFDVEADNSSAKNGNQNMCYLSLNYSSLEVDDIVRTISKKLCSSNNGETFNILDNSFNLFLNYQLVNEGNQTNSQTQLSTNLRKLPSFSVFYNLYQNESCSNSQADEFDLSQVGLWFLVSLSSIVAIGFFVSHGGLKHCRENRVCCYTHKHRVGSRRNSAAGGTQVNTPKSTRRPRAYLTPDRYLNPNQRRMSLSSIALNSLQPSLNGSPKSSTASAPSPSGLTQQQNNTGGAAAGVNNPPKIPSVAVTIETCMNGDITGAMNYGKDADSNSGKMSVLNNVGSPPVTVDAKLLTVPNNLPMGTKKNPNEAKNYAELKKKRRNLLRIGKPIKDDENGRAKDIEKAEEVKSMAKKNNSPISPPEGVENAGFVPDDDVSVLGHAGDATSNNIENQSAPVEISKAKQNVINNDNKPKKVNKSESSLEAVPVKKHDRGNEREEKKTDKLTKVDQKFKSLPINKPNNIGKAISAATAAERRGTQQLNNLKGFSYITSNETNFRGRGSGTILREEAKESGEGIGGGSGSDGGGGEGRIASISSFLHSTTNGSTIAINN